MKEITKAMRDEALKIEQEHARKHQELQEQQAAKKLAESNSLLDSAKFADACTPHIEILAKEIEEMFGEHCDVFFNDKPESLKKNHTHGFGVGVKVTTKEIERMGDRASAYFWVSPGTDGVRCEWKMFGPNLKSQFIMIKPVEQIMKNCLKRWAIEIVGTCKRQLSKQRAEAARSPLLAEGNN